MWDVLSHVSRQRVKTKSLLTNQLMMIHVLSETFDFIGRLPQFVHISGEMTCLHVLLKLCFTTVDTQHAGVRLTKYLSVIWCCYSSFSNYFQCLSGPGNVIITYKSGVVTEHEI